MTAASRSLYRRAVAWLMLVLCVVGAMLMAAAWPYARVAADESFDQVLEAGALQIAENTWLKDGALNVDVPVSAFYIMSRHDRVFYKVIDPKGRVIAGDPELPVQIDMRALTRGPVLQTGVYQGESVRIALIARQMFDPGPQGWAVVALAETQDARHALARSLVGKLLLIILAMGAVTIAGAMLAVRQALRPLADMTRALDARDPNSLEPLTLDTPVEIEPLVANLNAFIARLNDRVALMRRVIGDVAHQIRTPITAVLAQVEMMQNEDSPAARERRVERIKLQLADTGQLIQRLISHAMVLHRADTAKPEEVDLADLVRQELMDLASQPRTEGTDLSFDAPDTPVMVPGDVVTLREAIKNVLDNALQHGARHRLAVHVRQTSTHVSVEVCDDGPGIPPDRWEVIRQPFAPRDGGRSGASLGLAIVQEVMRTHRGAMDFCHRPDGDFAVTLHLPVA